MAFKIARSFRDTGMQSRYQWIQNTSPWLHHDGSLQEETSTIRWSDLQGIGARLRALNAFASESNDLFLLFLLLPWRTGRRSGEANVVTEHQRCPLERLR
jgi:hypothetical protein